MPSTGLILDSFNEGWYKRFHDQWYESSLTGWHPAVKYRVRFEDMAITFEDVTKIESIRRELEAWQDKLGAYCGAHNFSAMMNSAQYYLPAETNKVLVEALVTYGVLKCTTLLDDASRLGVDVTASRAALQKIMDSVKQEQKEEKEDVCN